VRASTTCAATHSSELATTCFETLVALADEHINNVAYHSVSQEWLGLYVDTNLLSALFDLSVARRRTGIDIDCRDRCVRKLDMAIIIGGAAMPQRMEWIQRAIKLAQVNLDEMQLKSSVTTSNEIPRKRRRVACAQELLFAPTAIPTLSRPPDIQRYLISHYNAPFVLRGYLDQTSESTSWSAFARWSDPQYLLSLVGGGRCVPVEEGNSYNDTDWGQRIVPFEDFLARAGFLGFDNTPDAPTGRPMYLAQHSLLRQFPELESDMSLPIYVGSGPPPTAEFPSYRAPDSESGVIVNVWVGSGSGEIVSPAHTVSELPAR